MDLRTGDVGRSLTFTGTFRELELDDGERDQHVLRSVENHDYAIRWLDVAREEEIVAQKVPLDARNHGRGRGRWVRQPRRRESHRCRPGHTRRRRATTAPPGDDDGPPAGSSPSGLTLAPKPEAIYTLGVRAREPWGLA